MQAKICSSVAVGLIPAYAQRLLETLTVISILRFENVFEHGEDPQVVVSL